MTILDCLVDGDIARLVKEIAGGADVNAPVEAKGSRYPLDMAVNNGWIDICRVLLEAGANPNRLSGSDWHPKEKKYVPLWHVMVGLNQKRFSEDIGLAITKLLLEHGANPNGALPDVKAPTPLVTAALEQRQSIVDVLIAAGADINGRTMKDSSPILLSLKERKLEALLIQFLRLGADDQCIAREGRTPFQEFVHAGLDAVVSFYVNERGEDLAQRTAAGKTLVQTTTSQSTRALLRSFKTDEAVRAAVDAPTSDNQCTASAKHSKGISPL